MARSQRVRWVVLALLAGLATIVVVVVWRGFPWLMALFSGIAVGALVFVTLQTSERIRGQFRRN